MMVYFPMKKAPLASNELINKVCLVSCIVFKLKGMTINFPALKALQRDCIKIQFIQVGAVRSSVSPGSLQSIRICFPGRYSSEHQQAENLPWKNKYCFCCDFW